MSMSLLSDMAFDLFEKNSKTRQKYNALSPRVKQKVVKDILKLSSDLIEAYSKGKE